MNILLVDDEAQVRQMLERRLTIKGYSVQVAQDGQQAWEIFAEVPHQFDMVLTDIKMPRLDGLQLFERIRKEDYKLPVVMMTGHAELRFAIQALKLGAFDFLQKPFDLLDLQKTLGKVESICSEKEQVKTLLPFYRGELQVAIESRTGLVNSVVACFQDHLAPICDAFGLNINRLNLCLIEALGNAIIHGNLGISSEIKEESWDLFAEMLQEREASPEYSGKQVTIVYRFQQHQIEFEVTDEGIGFDYENLPSFADSNPLVFSGRGILLIRAYMDEVRWNESGNQITMIKYLPDPSQPDSDE